jgi:bacillithiol system protein YtxJ
MSNHFQEVQEPGALEELINRSEKGPVVIFKHSTACPVSANAYDQMSALKSEVTLVVVQRARALSQEIATTTGISHESPQVIILRNGKPVWHKSHWDIDSESVAQAMEQNS